LSALPIPLTINQVLQIGISGFLARNVSTAVCARDARVSHHGIEATKQRLCNFGDSPYVAIRSVRGVDAD